MPSLPAAQLSFTVLTDAEVTAALAEGKPDHPVCREVARLKQANLVFFNDYVTTKRVHPFVNGYPRPLAPIEMAAWHLALAEISKL
jgi:hypothetical protein